MRIDYADGDEWQPLATSVRVADSTLSQAFGLMGRSPLQPDEAMVFRFDSVETRRIHTWFVRGELDVLWIVNEKLEARRRLSPWRIGPAEPADTIAELPGGAASGLEPGTAIRLVSEEADAD